MKISDLFLSIDLKEFSSQGALDPLASDILRQAVFNGDVEKLIEKNGVLDEFSSESLASLLRRRAQSAEKAGKQLHGASEALQELSRAAALDKFAWVAIPTNSYLSIVIAKVNPPQPVGCLALKQNTSEERLHTPPNWDGSKEMLYKFNNK